MNRTCISTWTFRGSQLLSLRTARPRLTRQVPSSRQSQVRRTSDNAALARTRNIGIIAHIDAGKTTTTERMLYYSGFTRRIGDVDDGSTVTDFLPAERARGITIQSAAITFHWPPSSEGSSDATLSTSLPRHTINLIDTPGHADFTFEVIRSLRILDGAICILDAVAGVEAQTEKVWMQANGFRIPRLIFINKLDRDGASFHRSVKDIASRLHSWPALCQIPWWKDGKFIGVGDVVDSHALSWEDTVDGNNFHLTSMAALEERDADFAAELRTARSALIELLTEHDDVLVEAFLDANENYDELPPSSIWQSLRRVILSGEQKMTPVFAGASFRNIGVQPLLHAVNKLLPAPPETQEPSVTLGAHACGLRGLLKGAVELNHTEARKNSSGSRVGQADKSRQSLSACALAFKVVHDHRRGVLVYVRVYSGLISRNTLLYNTTLGVTERAQRLLQMHANDAVETEILEEGQIGVIPGLKHARTGDTLIVYPGTTAKTAPPVPFNTLQLQPIDVPPPLFFTSIEPNSLSEEKSLEGALSLLLREDPSLSVTKDLESGQTQLAGMGELHLEIARDKLMNDYKVKASMGRIAISYREAIVEHSQAATRSFEREVSGRMASASCTVSVEPVELNTQASTGDDHSQRFELSDNNVLTIRHPTLDRKGKPISSDTCGFPEGLSFRSVLAAFRSGATAALARGPAYGVPVDSVHVQLHFVPSQHLTPTSDASTLTAAARLATSAALKAASQAQPAVLMEPVMLATITVNESAIGDVVHDLNSARGAHVLSLDAATEDHANHVSGMQSELDARQLTPAQVDKIYAPPDPFGASGIGNTMDEASMRMRQIKARVPLKEMVGYLKYLRSLTGGRGSFVMAIDRFERMTTQRMRTVLAEMRGDYV